ncbi:MAG TPA: SulP family inorganic anion transporter [Burkholderiaceae bacterium]|nr:SulP family inorganic anion transporter [Burkholderiaceae bacterium]
MSPILQWWSRLAPGLPALARYEQRDLPHDIAAGVAVAAMAIPGSVATAQLVGFSPVVGLYASSLPLIAYALFGTSRQLMIGPSAATAAIVAAGVAPLAGGDPDRALALAIALTFITGVLLIGASFLRLGAMADFLSKPILVGFMNGVAINVVLSQIGGLFGFRMEAGGIVPRALEFVGKLPQTHFPTLAVGLATIALLLLLPRLVPKVPASLAAMVVAGVAVQWLGLEALGVRTVGPVPGGFPLPRIPEVPLDQLPVLVAEAAGLALVLFSTTMVAARAFADRNRYEIDADREVAALGVSNIAAAFVQGFVVTGTNSRTAVGELAGGRTQMAGVVTALVVAAMVAFFTWPLQFIPSVALAAMLVVAGASLFSWENMASIGRIDKREVWIATIATIGVIVVGVMNAILLAVVLALLSFVQLSARPRVERLGTIEGQAGFHSLARHPEASAPEGLVLFRFNGAIIFFSAAYFRRQVLASVSGGEARWFVLDLAPVNMVDATGVFTIKQLFDELRERGIVTCAVGREAEWAEWAAARGLQERLSMTRFFPTLGQAVSAYRSETGEPHEPGTGAAPTPAA